MPLVNGSYVAKKQEHFEISKIPHHVVRNIVEYMVDNNKAKDAAEARATLYLYSARELFEMYLEWNGIVNWTDTILTAIDGIRASQRV